MHNAVGKILENIYVPDNRIWLSGMIYGVCLILSIIISHVPIKLVKMMVQ